MHSISLFLEIFSSCQRLSVNVTCIRGIGCAVTFTPLRLQTNETYERECRSILSPLFQIKSENRFFFSYRYLCERRFSRKKTRLCILEHRVVLNIRVKYGGNTMKIPNSCKNLKNRLKLVNRVEGRKRIHGFEARFTRISRQS